MFGRRGTRCFSAQWMSHRLTARPYTHTLTYIRSQRPDSIILPRDNIDPRVLWTPASASHFSYQRRKSGFTFRYLSSHLSLSLSPSSSESYRHPLLLTHLLTLHQGLRDHWVSMGIYNVYISQSGVICGIFVSLNNACDCRPVFVHIGKCKCWMQAVKFALTTSLCVQQR